MGPLRSRSVLLALLASFVVSGIAQAEHRRSGKVVPSSASRPETFGIVDYTVTSLSDLSFTAFDTSFDYAADALDYFRYVTTAGGNGSFVVGAEIPAGAVIDYIGLGACDTAGGGFTVLVYELDDTGNFAAITQFDSSAHPVAFPCGTDYNATALGYQIQYNAEHTIQIQVGQNASAATDGSARFSNVEIWWHRSVSPAPAVATFNDVPTGHPFFQFVEALAASGITGGCGNGNYCPDAPLTRGQMAVFLSKALGLHFNGIPPI
jgi:hypothetical protein